MLPGLALDLSSLVVALGNGRSEVPIRGDHDECHIGLRCACDHVLDEVTVPWRIDDGVVPLVSVEFLRGASNGHSSLALLLLPVHVEGKCE